MQQYGSKIERVESNVEGIKASVIQLVTKKRQIENLALQRKLENRLKDASADFTTLTSALDKVQEKASAFSQNKNDVVATMAVIKSQLAKLKGKDPTAEGAQAASGPEDPSVEAEAEG